MNSQHDFELLTALLGQEKDQYAKLLELSKKQKQLIIRNKTGELDELLKEQSELLNEASALGAQRMELSKKLARVKKIEDITIGALAEHADPAQRKALLKVQTQFNEILSEHKRITGENQNLINDQLGYIDFMLETIVQGERADHNYNDDGTAKGWQGGHTSLFDHKA